MQWSSWQKSGIKVTEWQQSAIHATKSSAQSDSRRDITVTLLADISVRSLSHVILQLKCWTGNNEFFVPCFFHNSSACDLHLIIKHLHKKQLKLTVIWSNTDHFIGFQIDEIRYLDSYKFQSSSLDNLVKKSTQQWCWLFQIHVTQIRRWWPKNFQKGNLSIYVYDDLWHFQADQLTINIGILFETKNGRNNRRPVQNSSTDVVYIKLWKYGRFSQCVVLSADCMENFQRVGIQEYGIDPAHCWTLARYTWQCCLKMTNLEYQLITDPNIYLMFENAIRGGVLSLIHIWRCRRSTLCRSRWSPYH